MKHFGKVFSELLFRSGVSQKAVGEQLGLSHVTVTRMKETPTVDALVLEKVCRVFHVPVTYFFDSDVLGEGESGGKTLHVAMLEQQNAMLQRLVDEKERTIQILLKA